MSTKDLQGPPADWGGGGGGEQEGNKQPAMSCTAYLNAMLTTDAERIHD